MKDKIIKELYKLSVKAYKNKEIPISAVILKDNKIIAKAHNKKNISNNALLHAEILCLQKAYKKLKRWNLNDCVMYVILEPCNMCKELIQNSRIDKVYYILPKGSINNSYNKTQYVQTFVNKKDSFEIMLKNFFENIRK